MTSGLSVTCGVAVLLSLTALTIEFRSSASFESTYSPRFGFDLILHALHTRSHAIVTLRHCQGKWHSLITIICLYICLSVYTSFAIVAVVSLIVESGWSGRFCAGASKLRDQ